MHYCTGSDVSRREHPSCEKITRPRGSLAAKCSGVLSVCSLFLFCLLLLIFSTFTKPSNRQKTQNKIFFLKASFWDVVNVEKGCLLLEESKKKRPHTCGQGHGSCSHHKSRWITYDQIASGSKGKTLAASIFVQVGSWPTPVEVCQSQPVRSHPPLETLSGCRVSTGASAATPPSAMSSLHIVVKVECEADGAHLHVSLQSIVFTICHFKKVVCVSVCEIKELLVEVQKVDVQLFPLKGHNK